MKPVLLLLIALLLVLTAHMRENDVPDAINPMDELIDRELMQDEHRKQTKARRTNECAAGFVFPYSSSHSSIMMTGANSVPGTNSAIPSNGSFIARRKGTSLVMSNLHQSLL